MRERRGDQDLSPPPTTPRSPTTRAVVTIEPGATARIPAPDGHTVLAYVADGPVTADADHFVERQHLIVFDRATGNVRRTAGNATARCLVLTGEPIAEPMVRYGPFVMNTVEQRQEAVDDFNAGRMGQIPAGVGVTRVHQP